VFLSSDIKGSSPKMEPRPKPVSILRSRQDGFSLIELLLSLVVLLIITTLAVPVVLRSLQSYQLNSAASQLSGMLKLTKFEAIRQNLPVSCQVQAQGGGWLVWVDLNGNGTVDPTEPQMFLTGSFALLAAGSVPDTSNIASSLGQGSTGVPWTILPSGGTSEWYDHRGVLCFSSQSAACPNAAPTIYAMYVGNPSDPSPGYRAIITLPSGAVQVWSATTGGPWTRVS
jgi:prepilin-type N-terminal cleavage/methylation domain-containing protein